jgi:cysteinyl-tRNA synthetase
MMASEKGFQRLMEAVKIIDSYQLSVDGKNTDNHQPSTINLKEWKEKCYVALTDDFNSPILISYLFEAVKFIFALKDGKETIAPQDLGELKNLMNAFVYDVLGLQNIEENNHAKLDQTLQVLIELRNQARKAKNFELSDQIRDKLLEKGIELKDGREGTSYILG